MQSDHAWKNVYQNRVYVVMWVVEGKGDGNVEGKRRNVLEGKKEK